MMDLAGKAAVAADKRKRSDTFSYFMVSILFTMFCLVLFALIKGDVKSEYGALVGGFGTTILGMFAVAVGFLWGSSKGSQLKDEAQIGGGPVPSTSTVITPTSTTTTSTTPSSTSTIKTTTEPPAATAEGKEHEKTISTHIGD